MHPVKLCSLGLVPTEYWNEDLLRLGVGKDVLLPSLECKEYTTERVERASIIDVLKTIGRDESFTSIPRWARGFLSKDYFLCSLEGWVFFYYPHHIKDIRKYKEVIFKCKNIYAYKYITSTRDSNGNRIELLGIKAYPYKYTPNIISDHLDDRQAI
jgi:hypothetical protein